MLCRKTSVKSLATEFKSTQVKDLFTKTVERFLWRQLKETSGSCVKSLPVS